MLRGGWIVGWVVVCAQLGGTAQAEDPVTVVYPVADLVISPASPPPVSPNLQPLLEHLQRAVAPESWTEKSAQSFPATFSLVIRQSKEVHRQLSDELEAMRRRLETQVVVELHVVAATKREMDEFLPRLRDVLASNRGESIDALYGPDGPALNANEREFLLDMAQGDPRCSLAGSPKFTLFREQAAKIAIDDWQFVVATKLAGDCQTVTLRIADHADDSTRAVARTQTVDFLAGTTRLLRFNAESSFPGVIPADPNAPEQLVVATVRTIDAAQKEVTQNLSGQAPSAANRE